MFLGKPQIISLQLLGAAGNMKSKMKSFTHCVCSKRLHKAHGSCCGRGRGSHSSRDRWG